MIKALPHIKFLGRIAIMMVLLFSLSPCTVKASVYQVLDVEYQSPLNKTKLSQININTCTSQAFTPTKAVKAHKVIVVGTPYVKYHSLNIVIPVFKATILKAQLQTIPGVRPPLYILYNRFKDDFSLI